MRFANLDVKWRGKAFYAEGAPETALAQNADLGTFQTLVREDLAGKLGV